MIFEAKSLGSYCARFVTTGASMLFDRAAPALITRRLAQADDLSDAH